MKKTGILLVLLVLVISGSSVAQITAFKAKTYSDSLGNELKYRIMKPADYDTTKSYPLVVFLHGAGERGSDNFSQLKWAVPHFSDPKMREKHPAFVVAPQVLKGQSWVPMSSIRDTTSYSLSMNHEPTQPMRLTIELLDQLQSNYSIDQDRLYVTGLSMGGFGTFDLIQRQPNKFAAAVPVAGGGDLTRAFFLKDMPIWAFHGAEDKIVPPKYSRSMISAIRVAGGSPGYTEYPDAGHEGTWIRAYSNSHLYEWMFSKSLDKLSSK